MTEQDKEILENAILFCKSMLDGKSIQVLSIEHGWHQIDCVESLLLSLYSEDKLRIKPEPKLRSLTKDEWYKKTEHNNQAFIKSKVDGRVYVVTDIRKFGETFLVTLYESKQGIRRYISSADIFEEFNFCDVYGSVISPCGVEAENE